MMVRSSTAVSGQGHTDVAALRRTRARSSTSWPGVRPCGPRSGVGSRRRSPAHRRGSGEAGGVPGRAGRAGSVVRRTARVTGERGTGLGGVARPALARLDGRDVRAAGPRPLVLSQLAALSYTRIATLTAGHVTVHDGTAAISTPAGTATLLRAADDPMLCGGVRGQPVAAGAGPGRHPAQPVGADPGRASSPTGHRPVTPPVPIHPIPNGGDPVGAAAAADRPMWLPPLPAAAVVPALAVPPRPRPPRR